MDDDQGPTGDVVDVMVIGAGLAGLAAAATAARAGRSVLVLDAHAPGGRARVDHRGGFTFNRGPRALYLDGPGHRVLRDLGVDTGHGGPPATKGGKVVRGGVLHALPGGPASLATSRVLTAAEKVQAARLLATLPRVDTTVLAGTSVSAWLDAIGARPGVRALLEMLTRITCYVDAPTEFDAGAAVANLQLGTGAGVRYLDGGFASLVDGLVSAATAAGARVEPGVGPVGAIEAGPERTWTVGLGARQVTARTVVVAAGGPDAAHAVLGIDPADRPALGPPATAACLELGLRRVPPHRLVFGVDEPLYLSTHCPPADLAPPGGAVVHLMRYQAPGDDTDPEVQRDRLRALAATAGIDRADVAEERFLARMVVTGAMPTAALGGLPGRPPVEVPGMPGCFRAGDWVGPTGLLADAALASGAEAGHLASTASATLAA